MRDTDTVEVPSIELTDEDPSAVSAGKKDNNAFLKIDGIDSESQDDHHKNEIQIGSFSFG
jgi:type VI protein secretion system component Hcp